ncbi:MAG: hypothetical protein WDZ48_08260 [Pirellulales bacterium]
MSQEILDAIGEHIGGTEIAYGTLHKKLRAIVPAAWRLWRDSKGKWAIFVLTGNTLSTVDENSIRKALPNKLRPLLIVQKYETLAAAASIYREVAPYVMYPIAGKLALIRPPTLLPPVAAPVHSPSRVPLDLLKEVQGLDGLGAELRKILRALTKSYSRLITTGKCNDDSEEDVLLEFAKKVLMHMGLKPDGIKATQLIRTIERDQFGASRDHFFHSFQNYFLGLAAISQLRADFLSFKDLAKVNWDIEPSDVWFLTAIWHDVGYAAQKFNKMADATFGEAEEDDEERDIKDEAIHRLLERPDANTGMRAMASLMAQLLKPQDATTQWLEPGPRTKLGPYADQILQAINRNTLKSHGALSAIRLYCDYTDTIENMVPAKRNLLRQTVLLACCSMPFHDFWFRSDVRAECAHCRLSVRALPFAALLAFVDSIQDDRRNLDAVREAVLILERLLVVPPRTVEAQINIAGLGEQQLLDKIIEGMDVLATLDQAADSLQFKYPEWIGA